MDGLRERISRLYTLAESSEFVFVSPLGPFSLQGRSYHLPRFIYFGPRSSDSAVRLAFLAGHDGADARISEALLAWLEQLATAPDLGEGLNLTFFPVVNPSGFQQHRRTNTLGQDLDAQHWNLSPSAEINLLAQDARLRAYHGFILLKCGDVPRVTGRVRFGIGSFDTSPGTIVEPQQDDPYPVQWLSEPTGGTVREGPLSLSEDLPFAPFEITLTLPARWPADQMTAATVDTLRRFIFRYRSRLAYGIHL